jgi:anti-sigma factor RsiW
MAQSDDPIGEADLVAFVDGRLDPGRKAAVVKWLDENPDERARIDSWRSQDDLLRTALNPILSEPVPERIVAPLRARRRNWLMPISMAASLVVGIGVGFWMWGGDESAAAREIAAIALSAHEVYIAEVRHPIEVPVSDKEHLVAWLSNRMDTAIEPPDLSASGLALLGGRVVPNDGKPAAMLMYEDDTGERYTLLIVRNAKSEVTSLRYAGNAGSGAYYWLNGAIGYAFSGPEDRDRLMRLTREIYEQLG